MVELYFLRSTQPFRLRPYSTSYYTGKPTYSDVLIILIHYFCCHFRRRIILQQIKHDRITNRMADGCNKDQRPTASENASLPVTRNDIDPKFRDRSRTIQYQSEERRHGLLEIYNINKT